MLRVRSHADVSGLAGVVCLPGTLPVPRVWSFAHLLGFIAVLIVPPSTRAVARRRANRIHELSW
jgi:hypothetical protein